MPPISGVSGRTPGTMTAEAHDVARNRQRVDDVARDDRRARRLLHVNLRRGARTLIVSSSEPTFISAFTVAVKFEGRSTPSRTTVPKPVSEKVSL